jgi:type IV secretion system protein VirB10
VGRELGLVFALSVGLAAVGLFAVLESRRHSLVAPAITRVADERGGAATMPPLIVPAEPEPPAPFPNVPYLPSEKPARAMPMAPAPPRYSPSYTQPPRPPLPPRNPQPDVVYRNGLGPMPAHGENALAANERVEATRLANPATTVPKGTVVQAVLESALDSSRAGLARAIVARDVYGFDGTRVLIPRGSLLVGEYKSDIAQGQSRALIEWQRLLRPDGAIINLASPTVDPLGRAGVKGKVNGHFMARFGGAVLQSVLNVGQQVAVNQLAPGGGIFAIPLNGINSGAIPQERVVPSVTVKQGTSIGVFVAKDLDFTSVEP